MSIIRTIHNKENPYVQLNKAALWNEKLSLKAIGLWARCMSRPNDWKFSVKELAKNGVEGRRAIYSAIDELIEQGYAIRLEHYEKNSNGKFEGAGVEYIFFEFPATESEKQFYSDEFKKSLRKCGFGNLHDGDLRNVPLLKKEEEVNIEKELTNKEESLLAPSEKQILRKKIGKRLSDDEFEYGYNCFKKTKTKVKIPSQWIIAAAKGKYNFDNSETTLEENKKALNWMKKSEKFSTHKDITIGYNYIEFRRGNNTCVKTIFENDFVQKIYSHCGVMNIKLGDHLLLLPEMIK